MTPQKGVKPDPSLWLPLLDEYRLTSLPHDTVLEGRLHQDLSAASPEVVDALAAWPASAYLHREGDTTHLVLVYQIKEERTAVPWLHALLLLATLITTLGSGALMAGADPFHTGVLSIGDVDLPYPRGVRWDVLWLGAPFALPFLGVLMAHEMGHYAAARAHRVRASLPYFIPFPPYFSVIGTVGAFIRLRGPIVRRSVLFDIGAAGPFASFLVSIPLLALGLTWSRVGSGTAPSGTPFVIFFLDQPVWLGSGLLTELLAALFAPAGEGPLLLHPLALVGWLGLFVTTLNLLPLGQLDGGHVLYALEPLGHRRAARAFFVLMLPLGFLWWGWWAWAALVLVLHRGRVHHPRVVQGDPHIGPRRTLLGWMVIAMFFLTFVVIPMQL